MKLSELKQIIKEELSKLNEIGRNHPREEDNPKRKSKFGLMKGASKSAKAADIEQSDIDYIIQQQKKRKGLDEVDGEPIGKLQMSQIREISGLEDFLWFKHTLDSKTIRRASMEEQKEWSQVTKELDDVLNHWVRLLLELDIKYPS